MSFREAVTMLGLSLTEEQQRACRYLERNGFKFCVNYGYENAVDLARNHWRQRRREQRRKRAL